MRLLFTARDRHRYCRQDDCSGAPPVTIRREGDPAQLLLSPGACPVACDTCEAPTCAPSPCTPMGVAVTRIAFDWDGTHYERGTCGNGVPCVSRRTAPPGRYVAESCARAGRRTDDSIGVPICIEGPERSCATAAFELPATGVIAAEL